MKHILVTGGLGFIGSHLVETLVGQGHFVVVVDDGSTNVVAPDFIHAINYDAQQSGIQSFALRAWAEYDPFDEIYHLASPVGPAGILDRAGEMVEQIVGDTYAVVKVANHSRARLVFVSTSEIYGGGVNGLCREDMPRIVQAETTVRLEYAIAKLAAETALINLCRTTPLQAVIVRPFNVAGPRQSAKGGFVLPRFVGQALRGEALTVFGDGSQVRAFTHVADIVEGLLSAMENGKSGTAYNLGNRANKTTILDLARRVIAANGGGTITFTDGKTVHGPLFAEAADKWPDSTRAVTGLGWLPLRGIDETIMDVIYYAVTQ
jgi:nucleoside-diphosphate-sugar epimerase